MPFKGSGDKRIIANQQLIINALDKIEAISQQQSNSLSSIQLDVSTNIVKGVQTIVTELQTQTDLLKGILKAVGGKVAPSPTSTSESGIVKDIIGSKEGKSNIGEFAKALVLLGAGFWAFGKGLGQMQNISKEQIMTITVILLAVFGTIMVISKTSNSLSASSIVIVAGSMIAIAMSLQSVSRILSQMADVSKKQLFNASIIAAVFVPITAAIVKIVGNLFKGRGFFGAIGNSINAIVSGVASMGTMIMLPIIAMTISATARILTTMPNKINLIQLSNAIAVSFALIPMIYAFNMLFTQLRGNFVNLIMMKITNKVLGADPTSGPLGLIRSIGSTLAVLPLLALTMVIVAWIFKMMPSKFIAPPIGWTFNVGLSLLFFSMTFTRVYGYLHMFKKEVGTGVYDIASKTEITKGKFSFGAFKSMGIIIMLSAGILATAWMMKGLPSEFKAPPLGWTLSIGLAMYLFSMSLKSIAMVIHGKKGIVLAFKSPISGGESQKVSNSQLLIAMASIPLVALSIVAIAWIMQALPDPSKFKAPPIGWILATGLALYLFGKGFAVFLKVMTGKDSTILKGGVGTETIKGQKLGLREIGMATLAQLMVAGSIISMAFIFLGLPTAEMFKSPPLMWTFKVGIAMYIFGKGMAMLMKVMNGKDKTVLNGDTLTETKGQKLGFREIVLATFAMSMIGTVILSLAFLFMALPPEKAFKAPPLMWILKVGLAAVMFSIGMSMLIKSIKGENELGQKLGLKEIGLATLAMLGIGLGVIGLAYLFMFLPTEKAFKSPPFAWSLKAGLAVAAFSIGMAILIRNIKGADIGSIGLVALAMGIIGVAIVLLAWTFKALPDEKQFKSPPYAWSLKAAIAVSLFGLTYLIFSKLKIKNLLYTSLQLDVIGASIVSLAWIFQALPNDPKALPLEWIISTGIAIVVFGTALAIIGKFGGDSIKNGATSMLYAGAAIGAIGAGIFLFIEGLGRIKGDPWEMIAIMGAIVVGLGAVMAVAGLKGVNDSIKKGAEVMLIAAAALGVISAGVWIFMDALSKVDSPWEMTALMGTVIVGLGAAMAAAGIPVIAAFITLGAGAMIVAGSALVLIAGGLFIMSKVYNEGRELFLPSSLDRKKTNLEIMLQSVTNGFSSIGFKDTLKIYAVAPALIMAGLSLITIGEGLAKFTQLVKDKIDIKTLGLNIAYITMVVAKAFGDIGIKFGGSGLTGLVLSFMGGDPVSKGIRMVSGMGEVLSSLAYGVQSWANLKFTLNGKEFKLGRGDFRNLERNIKMIISGEDGKGGLTGVFGTLGASPNAQTDWWFGESNIEKGINSIKGMGEPLSELAKAIIDWAGLKFMYNGHEIQITPGHIAMVQNNIRSIISGYVDKNGKRTGGLTGIFGELGASGGAQTDWFFGESNIEKGINQIKNIGEPLLNLATMVEKMANLTFGDVKLDENKIAVVDKNIKAMVMGLTKTIGEVGSKDSAKHGWFTDSDMTNGLDVIENIGNRFGVLIGVVDDIIKIGTENDGIFGVYDKNGILLAPGLFENNINSMIRGLTFPIGLLGSDDKATHLKYNIFGIDNIKKGVEIIEMLDGKFDNLIDITERISKFDDAELLASNVKHIIMAAPLGLLAVYNLTKDQLRDKNTVKLLTETMPQNFAGMVEAIAKHANAMDKVASSFERIAKSTADFKEAINDLNIRKVDKMNTMFDSISEIYKYEIKVGGDGIASGISEGISTGIEKGLDLIGQFSDKINNMFKSSTKSAAVVTPVAITKNEPTNAPTKSATVQAVADLTSLKLSMDNMSSKLDELINEIKGELKVRVTNQQLNIQ